MEITDCAKCGLSEDAETLSVIRWTEIEDGKEIKRAGYICERCYYEIKSGELQTNKQKLK